VKNTKKYIVVVNPRGGTRRGLAILESVKPIFDAAGAELKVHVTTHAGHVQELAKSSNLLDCDGFCVVGGDGTIHEAVGGLMQQEHSNSTPLGIIPAGTGNSVVKHLGSIEPLEAARRIVAGNAQSLDVIRVVMGDKFAYCVNIVGWGGVVDINCTAEKLRILGPPRYIMSAMLHILRAKRRRAKLVLDGKTFEDDFVFVIACNTKYTGKGMQIAPLADWNDGKMDVVVVRDTSRWQMSRLMKKIYNGSHLEMSCVEYHQVRSLEIISECCDNLNLDGELKGMTPVTTEVLPGALRIFA